MLHLFICSFVDLLSFDFFICWSVDLFISLSLHLLIFSPLHLSTSLLLYLLISSSLHLFIFNLFICSFVDLLICWSLYLYISSSPHLFAPSSLNHSTFVFVDLFNPASQQHHSFAVALLMLYNYGCYRYQRIFCQCHFQDVPLSQWTIQFTSLVIWYWRVWKIRTDNLQTQLSKEQWRKTKKEFREHKRNILEVSKGHQRNITAALKNWKT